MENIELGNLHSPGPVYACLRPKPDDNARFPPPLSPAPSYTSTDRARGSAILAGLNRQLRAPTCTTGEQARSTLPAERNPLVGPSGPPPSQAQKNRPVHPSGPQTRQVVRETRQSEMLSCMKSMVYCITSTLCCPCPCRHWEDIVLGILLLIPLLAVPFLLIGVWILFITGTLKL